MNFVFWFCEFFESYKFLESDKEIFKDIFKGVFYVKYMKVLFLEFDSDF